MADENLKACPFCASVPVYVGPRSRLSIWHPKRHCPLSEMVFLAEQWDCRPPERDARVRELEAAGRGIIGKRITHSGYCATVACNCPPEDVAFFRAFGECPTCKDGGGCVDCRKKSGQGGR